MGRGKSRATRGQALSLQIDHSFPWLGHLSDFSPPPRFVRWSDGSLQLMIGDEVFDVSEHDMAMDNNFVFMSHPGGVIQVCSTFTLNSSFNNKVRNSL